MLKFLEWRDQGGIEESRKSSWIQLQIPGDFIMKRKERQEFQTKCQCGNWHPILSEPKIIAVQNIL